MTRSPLLLSLLAPLLFASGIASAQATPANPNQPVDPTSPTSASPASPGTLTTTPGYAGAAISGTPGTDSNNASMPQRPNGPIRVSGGVMAGNLLTRVSPVYPDDARANGVQGAVVLAITIGRDGTVQKVSVVSGPPALASAATTAVRQWVYKPYLLNGKPVDVSTVITVHFDPSQASQR